MSVQSWSWRSYWPTGYAAENSDSVASWRARRGPDVHGRQIERPRDQASTGLVHQQEAPNVRRFLVPHRGCAVCSGIGSYVSLCANQACRVVVWCGVRDSRR